MVQAAAEEGFGQTRLERVIKSMRKLPPRVRKKVRKAFAKGKVHSVNDVEKLGWDALRQEREHLQPKEIIDIMEIILKSAVKVRQLLEDFMPYRDSFQINENWRGFNSQMESLIAKWEKFKTKERRKTA